MYNRLGTTSCEFVHVFSEIKYRRPFKANQVDQEMTNNATEAALQQGRMSLKQNDNEQGCHQQHNNKLGWLNS